jgi:hypothetical protein
MLVEELLPGISTSTGPMRFILGTVPSSKLLPPFLLANPAIGEGFDGHNELLEELPDSFPSTHPGSNVSIFDFGGEEVKVTTEAARLGFTSAQPSDPKPYATLPQIWGREEGPSAPTRPPTTAGTCSIPQRALTPSSGRRSSANLRLRLAAGRDQSDLQPLRP